MWRTVPAGGVSAASALSRNPGELLQGAAKRSASDCDDCHRRRSRERGGSGRMTRATADGGHPRPCRCWRSAAARSSCFRSLIGLLIDASLVEVGHAALPGRGSRACGRRFPSTGAPLRSRRSRARRGGGPRSPRVAREPTSRAAGPPERSWPPRGSRSPRRRAVRLHRERTPRLVMNRPPRRASYSLCRAMRTATPAAALAPARSEALRQARRRTSLLRDRTLPPVRAPGAEEGEHRREWRS